LNVFCCVRYPQILIIIILFKFYFRKDVAECKKKDSVFRLNFFSGFKHRDLVDEKKQENLLSIALLYKYSFLDQNEHQSFPNLQTKHIESGSAKKNNKN
jgi:hypothetical protein